MLKVDPNPKSQLNKNTPKTLNTTLASVFDIWKLILMLFFLSSLQHSPACLTLRARRLSTALSSLCPPLDLKRLFGRQASLCGVSVKKILGHYAIYWPAFISSNR